MKFVYLLVWSWEWFGDLLLICWCCIPCCKLRFGIKIVISSFFIWACHLHCIWDMVVVRGCTISRDVSRAMKVTIIEGRVASRDRCMDRYVPHGSRIERHRVCITRSDMHHDTWHCIPLHCTYLSLVNLILCFADLVIAFLRNLWLLNTELVIEDI